MHIEAMCIDLGTYAWLKDSFCASIDTSRVRRVITASGTISETRNRSAEVLNTESLAFHVFHCIHVCIFIACTKSKKRNNVIGIISILLLE